MEQIEIFQRFATALAIGVVVGVERHWHERNEADGQRTAGVRTFSLIGMLGGTAGLIARALPADFAGAAIVITGLFCGFAAIFAFYSHREALAENDYSVTGVVAAMLTFVLGVLAVIGDLALASAGGAVLVAILASREVLHSFMRRLTWPELRSATVLLGMTFVVLPLMPDHPIGPFGGVSPATIWLLVVILAAISFCGYIAVRLLGSSRGELIAGAIGGLVSSTGVTLANARRSVDAGDAAPLTAGALGAGAVSYLRTAALVALLAAPLGRTLVPPLIAAALMMSAWAALLARHGQFDHPEQMAKNPFDLDAVVKMAALLVGVAYVARAAAQWFGGGGLILVSALSGLADVDAAVVTVAGMLVDTSHPVAILAIGAAVVANTIAKAIYALAFGSRSFGVRFLGVSAASLVIGVGIFIWTGRVQ